MAARARKPGESFKKYRRNLKAEETNLKNRLRFGRKVYDASTEHVRLTHGKKTRERKPATVTFRRQVDLSLSPTDRYYA